MSRTIYKYEMNSADNTMFRTPEIVRWLDVQIQRGAVCAWAEVDLNTELRDTILQTRGTGHPMRGNEGDHIGTIQDGPLVFHVFESK